MEEVKKEEPVETTDDEKIARMEETTKKLNEAYSRAETSRAQLKEDQAKMMLGGKAESGGPPVVPKTKEELLAEDLQSVFPDEYLPRSFRRKK